MSRNRKLTASMAIILSASTITVVAGFFLLNRDSAPPINLMITMDRTLCSGICSTSLLTISGDGMVTFEGKANSIIKGTRTAVISRDKVLELVRGIEEARFFSLQSSYYDPAPGTPLITLSITIDGRKKSVFHYGPCGASGGNVAPPELCNLEKQVRETGNSQQWVEDRYRFSGRDPISLTLTKLTGAVRNVCPRCVAP